MTMKARQAARVRMSVSDLKPRRSIMLVRKLSAMAQNDVSMAQKAKALTMTKKTGDPRARPQDKDATSEISSTGSMRKTASGTRARMTKEMPAPARMDGTSFPGSCVKPREISGTMYWTA